MAKYQRCANTRLLNTIIKHLKKEGFIVADEPEIRLIIRKAINEFEKKESDLFLDNILCKTGK